MHSNTNKLFDLGGRVAIVTGGAGWLGSALSEGLAQSGAKVCVVDFNQDYLDQMRSRFENNGVKAEFINADTMQESGLKRCLDAVASGFGRLDILVNCAYTGPSPEIDEATFEDFDKGLHNGVSAYGIAAQTAVKHMRKIGGGSIINIGSMYGMVTGYPEVYAGVTKPTSIVYQAGKAAVIQMTKYMAVYWAKDHIRVNCISPGPFLQRDIPVKLPLFAARISQKVPMGRFGQPHEIKGAAVFLASDASSFITGQNIVIDGGWTSW
ncbi:MAG: hypothetical protein A2Y12_15565 [Planctomycetes bacterium GWF2_42_9]|nr:MAG: hypothetical protein A2Y12_15565 [Planctomycetes bacterium GWF2_42_9]